MKKLRWMLTAFLLAICLSAFGLTGMTARAADVPAISFGISSDTAAGIEISVIFYSPASTPVGAGVFGIRYDNAKLTLLSVDASSRVTLSKNAVADANSVGCLNVSFTETDGMPATGTVLLTLKFAPVVTVTSATGTQIVAGSPVFRTATGTTTGSPSFCDTSARDVTSSVKLSSCTYTLKANACAHASVKDEGAIAPSCIHLGQSAGKRCVSCGVFTVAPSTLPLSKTNHENVQSVGKIAPTCLVQGATAGVRCLDCGTVVSGCEPIAKTGHKEADNPGTAATCVAQGVSDGKICSVCGMILQAQHTLPIDPSHHAHTDVEKGTPATCSEKGVSDRIRCLDCQKVVSGGKEIPKLPHQTETTEGRPATCTETGMTDTERCTVCGTTVRASQTIPSLGHDLQVSKVLSEATCSEAGRSSFACSRCSYTTTEEVKALGHAYGSYFPVSEATCTEAGKSVRICARCGAEQEKTDRALGHIRRTETFEVSCAADGYTLTTCERCDLYEKKNVTEAYGHDYVEVIVEQPTEKFRGYAENICTICGNAEDGSGRILPKIGETLPDPEDPEKPEKLGFFARLKAFFQRISDFFDRLFGRKPAEDSTEDVTENPDEEPTDVTEDDADVAERQFPLLG